MDNLKDIIAYNSDDLEKLSIVKSAKKWFQLNLISQDTFDNVKFNSQSNIANTNLFIRIGIFIFTVIGFCVTVGWFSILISSNSDGYRNRNENFILFFDILVAFAALELFIHQSKKYKSGIDDALLYIGLGLIFTLINILTDKIHSNELIISSIFLFILILSALRYVDILVAGLAYCCALVVVFYLFLTFGEVAKYIMPFVLMLVSAGSYLLILKYKNNEKLRFWSELIWVIELLTLITFYLSGNYFVIRTSSEEFFNLVIGPNQDIPFAWVFYIFTAIVPMLYIFYGLKNKNRTVLNAGFILLAVSVLTFKYYFSLGHPEISLTIAGLVLIAIAYISIRYLKTPKFNITFEEDKSINKSLLDLENIVVNQSVNSPNVLDSNFDGGDFGGGGASGDY